MRRPSLTSLLAVPAAGLLALVIAHGAGASASNPSDPYFPQQWSLYNDGSQTIPIDEDSLHTEMQKGVAGADIGWLGARAELSKLSASPVIVAVIDTGVDPNHPDLAGRVSPQGFDFIKNSSSISDEPDGQDPTQSNAGHGTHVSGIIAANADNAIGIAGIAPSGVQILPLRILSDNYKNFAYNGKLISDYAADAINYAVAHGASIINLSLGWPKIVDTRNARDAVKNAISKGVLIVAAAGNDRKDLPTYPCAYDGVLCVGAVTNTGAMALYSNLGGMVDILAPGDDIVSTYPTDVESKVLRIQGYEMLSGTSMASPEVAGVAAALKAVIPGLSLEELEARLLISGSPVPAGMGNTNAALYGLVNLKRALEAAPQPVYLPDFKSIDEIPVDEKTLQISGSVSVENLWASAAGVQAEIAVNGVSAGTAQASSLAQGAKIEIPWKYAFSSLDDSSILHLSLRISDASGNAKTFSADLPAVRAMEKITNTRITSLPAVAPAGALIGLGAGKPYTNLSLVSSFPPRTGAPQYFMQHRNAQGGFDYGAAGCLMDIIDPSAGTPIQTVPVPGIQRVIQVLRLNENWVIIGLGNLESPAPFYEFYFLDSKFQPLWGSNGGSEWQIGLNTGIGEDVIRDYSAAGSWVMADGKLIPCFLDATMLPPSDNFGGFDLRHYQADEHLIYLLPQPQNGNNPIQLQVHGLDNAKFRSQFASNPHIQTLIPPDAADERAGHIRALITTGNDLNAQTLLWDIPSIASSSTHPASGWDQLSSSGMPVPAISSSTSLNASQSAFLNFFDQARGSLAWATSQGRFLDRSEFDYSSPANPITGLIGAFELPSAGRFWFASTQFDLVGYSQVSATGDAGITMQKLPIDRDSSFQDEDFSRMFTPVLVGTSSEPLPGVYIDSTLVRGNMVSVAVLNPRTGSLTKPLRYSLQIPASCLQMNPVHLDDTPQSFALPILCLPAGSTQAQLKLVIPQSE